MHVVKCYNCDWEGNEDELVREPAELMFYDIMLKDNLNNVEVTRFNLLCPRCRTLFKSKRCIDGVVFER